MEEGASNPPHPHSPLTLQLAGRPLLFAQVQTPPPRAVHTQGLSRSPGLTRHYLHSPASFPSTRDVYLNFKWPGLFGALEARVLKAP